MTKGILSTFFACMASVRASITSVYYPTTLALMTIMINFIQSKSLLLVSLKRSGRTLSVVCFASIGMLMIQLSLSAIHMTMIIPDLNYWSFLVIMCTLCLIINMTQLILNVSKTYNHKSNIWVPLH